MSILSVDHFMLTVNKSNKNKGGFAKKIEQNFAFTLSDSMTIFVYLERLGLIKNLGGKRISLMHNQISFMIVESGNELFIS